MKLFVKCTRNGEDSYVAYEGMEESTITELLTDLGATDIQFIEEAAWNSAVAAQNA